MQYEHDKRTVMDDYPMSMGGGMAPHPKPSMEDCKYRQDKDCVALRYLDRKKAHGKKDTWNKALKRSMKQLSSAYRSKGVGAYRRRYADMYDDPPKRTSRKKKSDSDSDSDCDSDSDSDSDSDCEPVVNAMKSFSLLAAESLKAVSSASAAAASIAVSGAGGLTGSVPGPGVPGSADGAPVGGSVGASATGRLGGALLRLKRDVALAGDMQHLALLDLANVNLSQEQRMVVSKAFYEACADLESSDISGQATRKRYHALVKARLGDRAAKEVAKVGLW